MPAKTRKPPAKKKPATPAAKAPPTPPLPPEALLVQLDPVENMPLVGPDVVDRMKALITPEFISQKLMRLLTATRFTMAGNEVDDTRAIEVGMKYWFQYVLGTPIQRQEITNKTVESEDQTMERAAKSPATRRHMRRMLDAMDSADGAVDSTS